MILKKSLFLLTGLVWVFFHGSIAQVNVWNVDDRAAYQSKEGIFYFLPATYLQVEVFYDLVEEFKGPYSDYAYKFLGLDAVITENRKFYELKDIRIIPSTVPDADHLYFIEFLQKQSKDPLALHLTMTEEGYIVAAALGREIPDEPDQVNEVVKQKEASFQQQILEDPFRYYATDNQVLKIDTIIKMVAIDTSTFKDVNYKRTMVYRTTEERASVAADFIETIRDDRFKLLTGYQEVDYSKETIEYMDTKLLEMEDAYLSLFKGYRQRESYSVRMGYLPVPDKTVQAEIFFRFSANEGLKKSDDPQGEPVYIRIDPIALPASGMQHGIDAQLTTGQGFVFRLPLLCQVTMTVKNEDKFSQVLPIHQLGMLNFYSVTSKFYIELYPSSGAFKQINVQ